MIGQQRLQLDGKRYVVLPETEYERLCRSAGEAVGDDDTLPPFPKPDRSGRFPAVEYTRIAIARDLIRDRKAASLSQQQLAELSGVRQETISRLETGKHTANTQTIRKLTQAIERRRRQRSR